MSEPDTIPIYVEGRHLRGEAGEIRIDRIANGWVYYVAWREGREVGNPIRMRREDFTRLCEERGMEAVDHE